jgi:hypothetical protein
LIYLGEKISARKAYSKELKCWLGVKIKGRTAYNCGGQGCLYCTNNRQRPGLKEDFRSLFDIDTIEELIVSSPKDLTKLNDLLEHKYIRRGYTEEDFRKEAKKLFVISGYEKWFLKEKKNYWLADLLDQHTCTYCNREYTFVLKPQHGKGLVPQFDHWFPKGDYPLLALSFYNLIPSCPTCNTIKSTDEMNLIEHFHPYVDSEIANSFSFDFLATSPTEYQVYLKDNTINGKGRNTYEALRLAEKYRGHSSKELKDLIDLRLKYPDNYIRTLLEDVFNFEVTEKERFRLLFGIEIEERLYHKRILSKFKHDIILKLMRMS